MDNKERIGFIGLGNMGSRMAEHILKAGYPLTVYDTSPEKMQPFSKRGIPTAATVIDLAARSDVVLCSVPDDTAVRVVMNGPDGVLTGPHDVRYFVNLSTVSPATSRELATTARNRGLAALDASVSGSTPQAEQATLVIFVGGDHAAYEHVRPVLELLGKGIFYMGASGSGSTMKLVVNTLLGVGIQAIAEAVALGQKAGLEKEKLLDVLGQTAVVAPAHKGKLADALRGDYPATFPLRLMYKDFGLILDEAAERAVAMPTTAVARQMCAARMARGVEEDYSAVIGLMERLANIESDTGPEKSR